jgi:hypothetical protein
MAFVLMFNNNLLEWNASLILVPVLIIGISTIAKIITAKIIDAELNIELLGLQRFWFSKWAHFKKPVLIGLFLPLFMGFLSGGSIKMLTFLQFNFTGSPRRVVKKYGTRRFYGISEWDGALIAFYGFVGVLLLAIITHFLNFSGFPLKVLSNYALYYTIWNLIPFGQMEGSRLFYGSKPLYSFSLAITLIAGLIVFL